MTIVRLLYLAFFYCFFYNETVYGGKHEKFKFGFS